MDCVWAFDVVGILLSDVTGPMQPDPKKKNGTEVVWQYVDVDVLFRHNAALQRKKMLVLKYSRGTMNKLSFPRKLSEGCGRSRDGRSPVTIVPVCIKLTPDDTISSHAGSPDRSSWTSSPAICCYPLAVYAIPTMWLFASCATLSMVGTVFKRRNTLRVRPANHIYPSSPRST